MQTTRALRDLEYADVQNAGAIADVIANSDRPTPVLVEARRAYGQAASAVAQACACGDLGIMDEWLTVAAAMRVVGASLARIGGMRP